jgi:SAM-dependent methyltransferase
MSSVQRSAISALLVLLGQLLCPVLALGQKPEYEFYYDFRKNFAQKLQEANHFALTGEQVLERYAAKLKSDGVSDQEIARRIRLIRADRSALDADYYSRFYLDRGSNFNHEPNGFLMEVTRGRQPGVALDYGMGQGRNAIYLAGLGWDVWGFDPAAGSVAIAEKRAKELGLRLHTAAVRDDEYDFGQSKFDLILFSWTKPLVPLQRVVDALKPGGIIVMECGDEFESERNALLHEFDSLQIVRYEIARAKADWAGRMETQVYRLVARKP